MVERLQNMLASKSYTDKSSVVSNTLTIAAFGGIVFVVVEILTDMFKLTAPVWDSLSYIGLGVCVVLAGIYWIVKKVRKEDVRDY